MKKKLQLEILNSAGEVIVTHHFLFDANENNRLRLTITDNKYIMDNQGKIIILVQTEFQNENNKIK
jgi:hypothetical protein